MIPTQHPPEHVHPTQAIHQLTNDEIVQTDGKSMAPQCFGLRLDRTVAGDRLELADRIEIRTFAPEADTV